MARTAPRWLRTLAKFGALLLIANEVRGLILAAPVLIALWNSGGTLMAVWIAFCSLAGIALSVAVPWWIARRLVHNQGATPAR
jgi:hypothetical protein